MLLPTSPHRPCELTLGLPPNQGLVGSRGYPEQPLASNDVDGNWFEKMPEAFGVEGQFCSVHKRANAIFLRLWGVLLFVQLFNPSRTFLCFLKVKQSVFRMRVGLTSLKLVSTIWAPGFSF